MTTKVYNTVLNERARPFGRQNFRISIEIQINSTR